MKQKTNARSKFKQSELKQSLFLMTHNELEIQASITNDVKPCFATGAVILDNAVTQSFQD
jgi:hypothetical protein